MKEQLVESIFVDVKLKKLVEDYPISANMWAHPVQLTDRIKNMFEIFNMLYSETKLHLANYFTENEVMLIAHCFNGGSMGDINQISPKQLLSLELNDGIFYDDADVIFNVNKEIFMDKIEKLNIFEAYVVLTMGHELWSDSHANKAFAENAKRIFGILS